MISQDHCYMDLALAEAQKAYNANEVPVGAVLVYQNHVISRAHNNVEKYHDATAHAELCTLQAACAVRKVKYLSDCTLYVTLEPCAMCAMACYWVQLGRLVFGATDLKRGYRCFSPNLLHPTTVLLGGLCANQSTALLKRFFQSLRKPLNKS